MQTCVKLFASPGNNILKTVATEGKCVDLREVV